MAEIMQRQNEIRQLRLRRRRDVGLFLIMAAMVAMAVFIEGLAGYILIDAVALVLFFRWVGQNFPDET